MYTYSLFSYTNIVFQLFHLIIQNGRLCLIYNQREYIFGSSKNSSDIVTMIVHHDDFFKNVFWNTDIGFAESYRNGYWTTDNLVDLLTLFGKNTIHNVYLNKITKWTNFFSRFKHVLKHNSVENSKTNIHLHYDLSNDMFLKFLDSSMTYSSAIFKDLATTFSNLLPAQMNKYNRIISMLNINKDDHILEIGCGWGSFAIQAVAQSGCKVTGISLSQQQIDYARDRIKEQKYENQIDIQYIDYRQVLGKFTKIVSIEMIEAVGHEYLNTYFKVISDRLEEGGTAMIQAICMPETRYKNYIRSVDFIQKYIFPGGCCPSIQAIVDNSCKHNLIVYDIKNIGLDYAKTLHIWNQQFLDNWNDIVKINPKFDDKFKNVWQYYLCYCESGFKNGYINTYQILFQKY
jgi:cyclopropane-fatty-acyl-phospholipid synthase